MHTAEGYLSPAHALAWWISSLVFLRSGIKHGDLQTRSLQQADVGTRCGTYAGAHLLAATFRRRFVFPSRRNWSGLPVCGRPCFQQRSRPIAGISSLRLRFERWTSQGRSVHLLVVK